MSDLPTPGLRDRWGARLRNWLLSGHNSDGTHDADAIGYDSTASGLGVPNVQAAIDAAKASTDADHVRYAKKLSPVPLNHFTNNIPNKIMRGVFVPSKSKVRAVFSASGYPRGITQFYFDLAWKKGPTWPAGDPIDIHNVPAYEALEPQLVSVGSIVVPASTHREIEIAGLAPGQPVTWELYLNDATYSNNYPTGASPKFVAVLDRTQGGSAFSSERYVAAVRLTSVDIVKVPLFPGERERSSIVASIALPQTGWQAKFSPDGTVLAVVCFAANAGYLVLIDTTTWTITRTVTLAASKAFTTCAFTSDSAKVWVGEATTHLLYPVTVATGAIGASVSVLSQPTDLRRRPGTNDIYVTSSTSQGLQVIDGATGTVKSTLAMGANTPNKIAFYPDGSKCIVGCVGTGPVIKEVDCSGAAPALTGRSAPWSTTGRNLAIDPGAKSLVAVSATAYWWWDLATLTQYDSGTMGSTTVNDLAMGNDGAIYVAETTESKVFCWPGGSLYINDEVEGGVRADWCELAVYGASAGPND